MTHSYLLQSYFVETFSFAQRIQPNNLASEDKTLKVWRLDRCSKTIACEVVVTLSGPVVAPASWVSTAHATGRFLVGVANQVRGLVSI